MEYISLFAPPETVIITGYEGYIMDEEAEKYYKESCNVKVYREYKETAYSKWLKDNCPF